MLKISWHAIVTDLSDLAAELHNKSLLPDIAISFIALQFICSNQLHRARVCAAVAVSLKYCSASNGIAGQY